MRDQYYADHRDLVKWGTLVHLCHTNSILTVVQVAFLQNSSRPSLHTPSGEVPIRDEVWAHFRDVRDISRLGATAGLNIHVVDMPFRGSRERYIELAIADLSRFAARKVVLLDPDTGIEPGRPNFTHVRRDEIRTIWDALAHEDLLVLYQHRRHEKQWSSTTHGDFATACRQIADQVEIYTSDFAPDVAFFAATKT